MALNLSQAQVHRALKQHTAKQVSRLTAPRRSAVAALLRFDRMSTEILVMKRAERKGDRWSGHISFPGGMQDSSDQSLFDTATRETLEEVGVNLNQAARPLGQLDDVRAVAKGNVLPLAITPFVFAQIAPVTLRLNAEAETAFWLPLDRIASGELDGTLEITMGKIPMRLGCWRYEDYVVWGLTYKMIKNLLAVVRG